MVATIVGLAVSGQLTLVAPVFAPNLKYPGRRSRVSCPGPSTLHVRAKRNIVTHKSSPKEAIHTVPAPQLCPIDLKTISEWTRRFGLGIATLNLVYTSLVAPSLAVPQVEAFEDKVEQASQRTCLPSPNITEVISGLAECKAVSVSGSDSDQLAEPTKETVSPEDVVLEAWTVVNENYLDARNKGFNKEAWEGPARLCLCTNSCETSWYTVTRYAQAEVTYVVHPQKQKEEALRRPIRSRMAAYSAIRAMLGSLNDPFTRFLSPEQFKELSKYDISGIGLNMGEVDDELGTTHLKVIGIVLDSAIAQAGIRQGDELLSVDDISISGKSAFEASTLMQGPLGSPVKLQFKNTCGESISVLVPRGMEARSPVSYRLEKGPDELPMGYIRLREFNALARKEVVQAVERLREGGARSFVLDLQDNPGGLVQAGVEIARLFLESDDIVVYTAGRTPESLKSIRAPGPPLTKAPLLVLVNDHTASASEIVAGALHDNCRALLVGRRTYGKGLIQSVYELNDGSGLVLTVGKYVTPSHVDIDGNGIEPDFVRDSSLWLQRPALPGLRETQEALAACRPPRDIVAAVVE